MSRTVHVDVTVHMVLNLQDSDSVSAFLEEMDYEISAPEGLEGSIRSTEITDYEVTE